ncbi:MAG: restriction endonuclease [Hyphomonadaceae bacterium]|nr:restriction endonuclease [Hyphomonadaceae bacterium]
MSEPNAWVLRIAPSRIDRLPLALETDQLIIGWADPDLTDPKLTWADFVDRLKAAYDYDNQQAGSATGNMMRFLREMREGDLVAVPAGAKQFRVAEVAGPATYDKNDIANDTAYRRPCKWLNGKQPIARIRASSALQSRLKARQTCVAATDLIADLRRVLDDTASGVTRTFLTDLREATLVQLQSPSSHLNEREFEHLVRDIFLRLGASRADITPRQMDKGDDIVATFKRLGITIVAQVKYHRDPSWKTGDDSLEQLISGMDARDADMGWLVTCGEFDFDVAERGRDLAARGKRIRFVDGAELAALLLDAGAGSPAEDD